MAVAEKTNKIRSRLMDTKTYRLFAFLSICFLFSVYAVIMNIEHSFSLMQKENLKFKFMKFAFCFCIKSSFLQPESIWVLILLVFVYHFWAKRIRNFSKASTPLSSYEFPYATKGLCSISRSLSKYLNICFTPFTSRSGFSPPPLSVS